MAKVTITIEDTGEKNISFDFKSKPNFFEENGGRLTGAQMLAQTIIEMVGLLSAKSEESE